MGGVTLGVGIGANGVGTCAGVGGVVAVGSVVAGSAVTVGLTGLSISVGLASVDV